MISLRSRIGQLAMTVAVVATVVLAGFSAPGAHAKPANDTRPMDEKVRSLKVDCEATGGSFYDRPSGTDKDKHLTKCEGGGLATVACVLTPTTGECFAVRVNPTENVWDLVEELGLGATTTSGPVGAGPTEPGANQSVSTAVDDQDPDASTDTKIKKHKKGKKGGKGRRK
jgi:hypothetical protein